MKRKILALLIGCCLIGANAFAAEDSRGSIIPQPRSTTLSDGDYVLPGTFSINTKHPSFMTLVVAGEASLNAALGNASGRKRAIKLVYDATITGQEAYQLLISKKKIEIRAAYPAGCFYGLQSLQQIIQAAIGNSESTLACVEIRDEPRYGWRGLMLDESRHFFGKETVKQLLDMMALQKLNKFHWHLTDEPGWRIEIKKYPDLTLVGGKGNFSNPQAEARFYTQADIKEIVQYAADRFIEVIPEIDMPGHATAANRAYPEFNGGGNEKHPDFTFHPGKEGTYGYLTDILREVAGLFPSKYIHIGGDEVHFGNDKWATDPEVNALMQREGLADVRAVEHYFLNRMSDSIAALNKTMIGWDEVTGAGLSPENTMVMWWRHDQKQLLKAAIENDYQVVMCPRRPLYLDFVQHESHQDGRRWGGFCPLDMIYAFPDVEMTGGDYYRSPKVLGVQANVWTERMHTTERLQFMIFPRLSAVAEAGWTVDENKNYQDFTERLKGMLEIYKQEGITFFDVLNPNDQNELVGPAKK